MVWRSRTAHRLVFSCPCTHNDSVTVNDTDAGSDCNNSSCTESIVSSTHTRMITQRMHDQTRQVRGDAAAVVQRAQRAQSVQAVSSLSADVSSLLIASCPHHITQSEIGSHTLTRLQPSPMSENRNANALPQASPFVTLTNLAGGDTNALKDDRFSWPLSFPVNGSATVPRSWCVHRPLTVARMMKYSPTSV